MQEIDGIPEQTEENKSRLKRVLPLILFASSLLVRKEKKKKIF